MFDQSAFKFAGSHNLIGDGGNLTWLVDGVDGNQVGTAEKPIDPQFIGYQQQRPESVGSALQPTSPAIDAGDDDVVRAEITTDLEGGPRIWGAAVGSQGVRVRLDRAQRGHRRISAFSPSSVAENQPAGTIVGTLSATDPDEGGSLPVQTRFPVQAIRTTPAFRSRSNLLQTTAVFDARTQEQLHDPGAGDGSGRACSWRRSSRPRRRRCPTGRWARRARRARRRTCRRAPASRRRSRRAPATVGAAPRRWPRPEAPGRGRRAAGSAARHHGSEQRRPDDGHRSRAVRRASGRPARAHRRRPAGPGTARPGRAGSGRARWPRRRRGRGWRSRCR